MSSNRSKGTGRKASSPAAAGERSALIGLRPQYRIAASLVLDALRTGQLEFIELTHNENGQVDDFASDHAKVPANANDKTSFAEFVAEAWTPVHEGSVTAAARHPVPWEELRKASGLDAEAFLRFVADCELDFGMAVPSTNSRLT